MDLLLSAQLSLGIEGKGVLEELVVAWSLENLGLSLVLLLYAIAIAVDVFNAIFHQLNCHSWRLLFWVVIILIILNRTFYKLSRAILHTEVRIDNRTLLIISNNGIFLIAVATLQVCLLIHYLFFYFTSLSISVNSWLHHLDKSEVVLVNPLHSATNITKLGRVEAE